MNNTRPPLIDLTKGRSNRRKRSYVSVQDQYIAQPQFEGSPLKPEQHTRILKSIKNKGLIVPSYDISCYTKLSGSEQLLLEVECTDKLQRQVDHCNSQYLKNFQLRLMMEVQEQ